MDDTTTLEQFKRAAAAFSAEAVTADREILEAGWTAVAKAYLNLPVDKLTLIMARGYLDYAAKRKIDREIILDSQNRLRNVIQ
jgi:hypothetical protein